MSEISSIAPAVQLMMVLAIWEVVKYSIRRFLGKTIDAHNVSQEEHREYRKKIEKDLRAIKGILLEVAMESGVPAGKLKTLTE